MRTRVFLTLRFFGTFLLLASLAIIITWAVGLRPAKTWPFILGAMGITGLYTGKRKNQRFSATFAIPSAVFLTLSVFFSLFSFGAIQMRLRDFVLRYWYTIAIAAAVFVALYLGFLSGARAHRGEDRGRRGD